MRASAVSPSIPTRWPNTALRKRESSASSGKGPIAVLVFEVVFDVLEARFAFRTTISNETENAKGQATECSQCRDSFKNGRAHITLPSLEIPRDSTQRGVDRRSQSRDRYNRSLSMYCRRRSMPATSTLELSWDQRSNSAGVMSRSRQNLTYPS